MSIIEFKVNTEYNSYDEFKNALKTFQKNNGQVFTTYRSDKLYLSDVKNKDIDISEKQALVAKLQYLRITLKCKLGSSTKTKDEKQKKIRVTRTFNTGCPVFIKLNTMEIQPGIYKLKITSLNLKHENHPSNFQELVYALPENRKLSPDVKKKVEDYLNLGCSNKKLRCELASKYNIFVTSKDISNIRQSLRPAHSNDITTFVNLLKTKYDCSTEIKTTDDGHFEALFFTNASMQASMRNWPDMLFIDGTYKLFNLGFTLYLIMVQTGSGRGEIVGVSILASETYNVMKWVAETFKEFNPEACLNTKSVMTDKDLTERAAFKKAFPSAQFLLCLFHTTKTFDRHLKKLPLTREERAYGFRLLRNLIYAKSEEDYNCMYKKFVDNVPECLLEYFNNNWHSNHNEWVTCFMIDNNYGNFTNNIIESINKQIKTICDYHGTLCEFLKNFFQLLSTSKQETNLLTAIDGLKKLNIQHELGAFVNEYADFLTKAAFDKFKKELEKYSGLTITKYCNSTKTCNMNVNGYQIMSTTTNCECHFHRSLKLPCVHILATRKYFNLNLFCPELCSAKWSKDANLNKLSQKFLEVSLADTIFNDLSTAISFTDFAVADSDEKNHVTVTNQHERQQILNKQFEIITNKILQASEKKFNHVYEELRKIGLNCDQDYNINDPTECSDADLLNVTLPEKKILRGRPKSARKTTTGFFPRKQ